jgi:hypothetical protein
MKDLNPEIVSAAREILESNDTIFVGDKYEMVEGR